jgi:hypothetical protein
MAISMKRIFIIVSTVAVAAALCACNDSFRGNSNNTAWGPNATITGARAIRTTIIKDILGGALTTSIDPNEFAFEKIEKKAMSVNVAFSAAAETINETYMFAGEDGAQALSITASGDVEEIDTPETGASILKYAPLDLLIHFEKFVFTNACGVQATITGDMECKVKGDYNRADENFNGTATCVSGTFIDGADITYLMVEQEHKINFSVSAKIEGNAFNPDSYNFMGTFFIDNRLVAIDNFVEGTLVCQSDTVY